MVVSILKLKNNFPSKPSADNNHYTELGNEDVYDHRADTRITMLNI